MGPDSPDAPVKNGLSAQPGNMESMALDRNSIFHANSTCRPTVVQVGVSVDEKASGDATISSCDANLNEERVKTKCSGSKKPTKKSNVKTVTKATKMNKKLQNTKSSLTNGQKNTQNFFDANGALNS